MGAAFGTRQGEAGKRRVRVEAVADEAGPALAMQRHGHDEVAAQERFGAGYARSQGRVDLGWSERRDGARDQPLAEVAVGLDRTGAARGGWRDGPAGRRALAITVAAASACAAVAASTVTASAMPSEKLRPRQPLVAMPRTGVVGARSRAVAEQARPVRPVDHADA